MPEFETINLEVFGNSIQDAFKLVRNGRCEYDEFTDEYEDHNEYAPEYKRVITITGMALNLETLPRTMWNPITPPGDPIKEYEAKSKNLRLYMFHWEHKGKIIVNGGHKNSQQNDITHFRNIKAEYAAQFG